MKKGFTLVELLAVILIISIVAVFAIPNLLKVFSTSKNGLSNIQKKQIEEAVEIYINDYCVNPISDDYTCPSSFTFSTDENDVKVIDSAHINLDDIKYYFDSDIENNCTGYIDISSGNMDLSNITCNFKK